MSGGWDWEPTAELRWFQPHPRAAPILQQRWDKRTVEWREIAGEERRVDGVKNKWMDVPIVRS